MFSKKNVVLILLLSMVFVGCSENKNVTPLPSKDFLEESGKVSAEYTEELEMMSIDDSEAYNYDSKKRENKVIVTGTLRMGSPDVENTVRAIETTVKLSGGYLEEYSFNKESKSYFSVIKIPAKEYKKTLEDIKQSGTVNSYNESYLDITMEYYDIKSRLETKKVEEERILSFIGKAEETEDIIALEKNLGDVRMEIGHFERKLSDADKNVKYSTLTLTISKEDVVALNINNEPEGIKDKIKDSFLLSLKVLAKFSEYILVFLSYTIIPIIITSIFIWIFFIIRRKFFKKDYK